MRCMLGVRPRERGRLPCWMSWRVWIRCVCVTPTTHARTRKHTHTHTTTHVHTHERTQACTLACARTHVYMHTHTYTHTHTHTHTHTQGGSIRRMLGSLVFAVDKVQWLYRCTSKTQPETAVQCRSRCAHIYQHSNPLFILLYQALKVTRSIVSYTHVPPSRS